MLTVCVIYIRLIIALPSTLASPTTRSDSHAGEPAELFRSAELAIDGYRAGSQARQAGDVAIIRRIERQRKVAPIYLDITRPLVRGKGIQKSG